ncbi:hypothetical protein [Corynebacterium sphenisci]|uniref:hypothetical protein n=1 Tax=Corynebacterium sphenisci TaxID=191493 RepID=UPI0012F48460|nr:hypothetical protein [Corynebacterium sphenisci]
MAGRNRSWRSAAVAAVVVPAALLGGCLPPGFGEDSAAAPDPDAWYGAQPTEEAPYASTPGTGELGAPGVGDPSGWWAVAIDERDQLSFSRNQPDQETALAAVGAREDSPFWASASEDTCLFVVRGTTLTDLNSGPYYGEFRDTTLDARYEASQACRKGGHVACEPRLSYCTGQVEPTKPFL